MIQRVHSKEAPEPIGPYSQAVVAGGLVFVSGQIGINPKTNKMVSDRIEEQTEMAISNIIAILRSAGLGVENVIKTTIFLKDMSDFQKVNGVYEKYFGRHKPARACVGVSELPKGALVEIEAVAISST